VNQNSQIEQQHLNLLLTAAGRAPSGGNTQPWHVEIKGNCFVFKLNPKRLNTFIKVNYLDAIFSLGSFAQNFEIAAQHLGYHFSSSISSPQINRRFSVTYTLTPNPLPSPHPLYHAIENRETNRQLSKGKLISQTEIQSLRNIIANTTSHYSLAATSSVQNKKELGHILGKVDVYRTKIIKHHQRMMAEIRWSDKEARETKDGIDIKTMELPGNVVRMLKLLRDHPTLVKTIPNLALEKSTHPLIENSSHLCCLHTHQKPTSQLLFDAGKVSELLWLEATRQHLAFHPWSVLTFFLLSIKFLPHDEFTPAQEIQLKQREAEFKKIMAIPSSNTLLLIFRLSYADPPSARSLRYNWKQYTTVID
jgi:hypothetical protein